MADRPTGAVPMPPFRLGALAQKRRCDRRSWMVPRVRLGHSSLEVVALGVGCWAWGDRPYWRYEEDHGPRDVVDAFAACLQAGLRLFATAAGYGWGKGG